MAKLIQNHIKAEKGLLENENQTYKSYKIEDLKDLKVFINEFVPYYRDLAREYGEEANAELVHNFPIDYAQRKDTKSIFTKRIFDQMIESNLPKLKLGMTDVEQEEFMKIYQELNSIQYEVEKETLAENGSSYPVKGADRVLRKIQNLEVVNYYLNFKMGLKEVLEEVRDAFKLIPDFRDKEVDIIFHANEGDGLLSGHKSYIAQVKDGDIDFSISIEPDYRFNYTDGTVVYYVVDARIAEIEYV